MLQIDNLVFSYHKKKAPIFEGINLTIHPGSVYGLLGKNGIGKSTLLYMMSGLMFPHKGHITLDGVEVRRRRPETLEKIFLVPEEFDLPAISVDAYVRRNSVFYPCFDREQFDRYLTDFELEPVKNLAKTSMGQKKKYLVSFALATNTPLLLMDEPTNGMDIPSKSQFRKVIASGMTEQKSIVISTHQVRDLENMIDRIDILTGGASCSTATRPPSPRACALSRGPARTTLRGLSTRSRPSRGTAPYCPTPQARSRRSTSRCSSTTPSKTRRRSNAYLPTL